MGVTIGVEHHLRVAMDGQEGLEIAMRLGEIDNCLDLRLRVGTRSTVRLRARVTTGTSTYKVKTTISAMMIRLRCADYMNLYCTVYAVPPYPVPQFLFGSTPIHEEPEFILLVLRHMRF